MAIILPWPLSRITPTQDTLASVVAPGGSSVVKRRTSVSSLLRHYEKPGVAPPSSRVDPLLPQTSHAFNLWHLWKMGALVAFKGECPGPPEATSATCTIVGVRWMGCACG
ncbi:hypothetical protein BV25DRAFT_1820562 [Artomyces pyxidatus]|uniref:Uncharacterized protein n=1 Tax=Artomyces pyxidatus TaxID=48021 RepID=A0ACB8TDR6_9AGAM|nr:hypothetical protein BV25DRAFT_1820562 [Artomyces pyxidatus]